MVDLDKESKRIREVIYIEARAIGLTPRQAIKRTGLCVNDASGVNAGKALRVMHKSEFVNIELQKLEDSNRKEMKITRDKVQAIVLEAIDMARLIADPTAIIRGAQELNKMCGFYAPEEKKITLTAGQRRLTAKYDTVSDEDLLAMIESQNQTQEVIEIELDPEDEYETVRSKFADREGYNKDVG